MRIHTRKAWNLYVFIGIFEVLDYLSYPITTSKAHAKTSGGVALLGKIFLKVSKFQRFQISATSLSLFYGMYLYLISMFHRQSGSLILFFLSKNEEGHFRSPLHRLRYFTGMASRVATR